MMFTKNAKEIMGDRSNKLLKYNIEAMPQLFKHSEVYDMLLKGGSS